MEYLKNFFLDLLDKTNVPQKESTINFFQEYNQSQSESHVTNLKELEQCENLEEIFYVDLIGENLYEIPSILFQCKNLKYLDLSSNFINSINGIKGFNKLEFLFLDECEQLKEIPNEIGELITLKGISISHSPIQKLPEEFFTLKNIIYCNLNDNDLTNEIFYDLEKLENIVELDLSSNKMLNEDGTALAFKNLIKANFSYNSFEILPIDFSKCILLEKLDISYNPIRKLPNSIMNSRKLVELEMKECLITECPDLSRLTSCKQVEMGHSELKNIPIAIFSIPNLETLEIENSNIKAISEQIGDLKNLKKLIISECLITTLPASIGKIINLSHLELRDNNITTLPPELGQLKNLSFLSLSNWNEGTNKITKLPAWIGGLKSLAQFGAENIDLEKLPKEIGNLSNLSILDLSNNPLHSLPLEFSDLRKLKSLNLFNCPLDGMPEIQEMGIEELFEYLNKLRGVGKYSFIWELPLSLQTAFQQYLNFFTDYMKKLEGYEINLQVVKTSGGLKLETEATDVLTIEQIGVYLNEYLDYIKDDIEFKEVDTNGDSNMELLRLQMENQINHFKQQVRQIEFENKYLRDTVDKLLEAQVNFSQGYLGINKQPLPTDSKVEKTTNLHQLKEFEKIRNLIVKNDFEKALNDLSLLIKEKYPSRLDEILTIYSRMNNVKFEARIGNISFEQKQIEINKIVSSLLEFLQTLHLK